MTFIDFKRVGKSRWEWCEYTLRYYPWHEKPWTLTCLGRFVGNYRGRSIIEQAVKRDLAAERAGERA